MFESLSHFDKIRVSKDVEPETVKGRLDSFADEAEKNEEEYKIHEVEPNEIEKQIIEDVLFGLEVMLIRVYGIEDVKEINPTKIHLVSAGALKEFGGGVHLGSTGSVYVENLESFFGSKISFASTLAHELLHFFSYKEGQLGVDQFHISRRGLDLSAEDVQEFRRYFNYIDEAVTAHFTMRFREMEMLAGRHGEYKEEATALVKVKAWLSSLPEDTPIDKNKWVGWIERYVVSIPYAEEMSRIIDNDNLSPELKVSFFQELVESLSEEERHKFYLERYGELNDISNDMEEAFKDLDREEKGEALDSLLKAVLKTKITGQGVREIYKLLEEKLGKGSFKRLAHKYARVVKKEP